VAEEELKPIKEDARKDPRLIVVHVAAAAGDEETIHDCFLGVRRGLATHDAIDPPPLPVFR
jgi:hypothetical protein